MKLTATKPPKRKVSHLSQKNRCSRRRHLRLHINRRRCHTKRQNCLGATQNRLQFILIRHSDLEIAPSKSIPEKYNRHTQQIVNHATQLDKKLFKLKCPVQSINTSSNIKFNFFKICFTNSHRERKINMIVLQSRELHFSRITIHYFHSMNNTFVCPTVSYFPQKAPKIHIKITEKPAFLNVDARRPLRFARQYQLKKSKDQKQGSDWCKISKFDTTQIPRCDWT